MKKNHYSLLVIIVVSFFIISLITNVKFVEAGDSCSLNQGSVLERSNGWTLIGPDNGKINTIETSPDKSIYYAGTASGGVFQSKDRGTSWQSLSTGLGASKINFLKFINGKLYAANNFAGIYVLNGNVWQNFLHIDGTSFVKIVYDQVHNTFWALADSSSDISMGLYFSNNGGTTWQKIAVDVGSCPDILVSKGGYIPLSNFNNVRQSDDEGNTWRVVFTTGAPASESSTRNPMIEDTNGVIYIAGLDSKLYRRKAGGNTFDDTTLDTGSFIVRDNDIISLTKADEIWFSDLNGKYITTVKSPSYSSGDGFWDVRQFLAVSSTKILIAHDNGISILDTNTKIVKHLGVIGGYSEITSLAVLNNASALLSTYWDHASQTSIDCGKSWNSPVFGEGDYIFANPKGSGYIVDDGFSNFNLLSYFVGYSSNLNGITVGGTNPAFNRTSISYDTTSSTTRAYAIGSNSDGQYLVGFDMAESAQAPMNVSQVKLPVSDAIGLATDPKISGRLILSGNNYVYESKDRGSTWTKILDYPQGGLGAPIAVNPTDSNEILLGNALLKNGIITNLSLPGGVSYAIYDDIVHDVLYAASPGIPQIGVGQAYPKSSGFFVSINGGKNWISFNNGLYSKDVRYIIPFNDKVFISTFGSGNAVILKKKLGINFSTSTPPVPILYNPKPPTLGSAPTAPTITQSINPERVTVNSSGTAVMTFGVPANIVKATLMMYCPGGLKISYGGQSDICNTTITLSLSPNTSNNTQFSVTNTTSSALKAVPNFYVYYPANPNFARGVSGEITVNPSSQISPVLPPVRIIPPTYTPPSSITPPTYTSSNGYTSSNSYQSSASKTSPVTAASVQSGWQAFLHFLHFLGF